MEFLSKEQTVKFAQIKPLLIITDGYWG